MKLFPSKCPSCSGALHVKRLECPECGTSLEGDFMPSLLAQLGQDEQGFLVNLVKANGSLKDLARVYGVSYPTVRNRLDALIESVNRLERQQTEEGSDHGE